MKNLITTFFLCFLTHYLFGQGCCKWPNNPCVGGVTENNCLNGAPVGAHWTLNGTCNAATGECEFPVLGCCEWPNNPCVGDVTENNCLNGAPVGAHWTLNGACNAATGECEFPVLGCCEWPNNPCFDGVTENNCLNGAPVGAHWTLNGTCNAATGECEFPVLGCCEWPNNPCVGDVTENNCLNGAPVGAHWTLNGTCNAATGECEFPVLGCCEWPNNPCFDGVTENNCLNGAPVGAHWTLNGTCNAATGECEFPVLGCCEWPNNPCFDGVTENNCLNGAPVGAHWTLNGTCNAATGECEFPNSGEDRASSNSQNNYYITGDQKASQENIISISKKDEYNNTSWSKTYGTTGYNSGEGISTDIQGNNIATGGIQNTVDFDTQTFTSYGNSDIFLVKNDENGNELWAVQAGSTAKDAGEDIIVDAIGNSYVVGQYGADANFDGQILAHTGTGAKGFIAKYNSNGGLTWVKSIEGTTANVVNSIAQNEQGDLFITGYFKGTATFGNETAQAISDFDLFVAKMDKNGNFTWVKTYENGEGFAITADYFGNAIIAGRQDDQMLLLKYSSYGVLVAERLITASEKLHAQDITNTCDGNVQVIGQFRGAINIDNNVIPSLGEQDIFLGEFNSNFATIYAKGEGGPLDDYGLGIYNEGTDFTSYVGCHFGTSTINGETTIAPSGSFIPFSTRFDVPCDDGGTVAINDQNNLESIISIQPNPFTDNITIEFNTLQASSFDIQLIDLLGRTIHEEEYKASSGRQTVNLTLREDLSTSIYLLQITDENGERYTEKLVRSY